MFRPFRFSLFLFGSLFVCLVGQPAGAVEYGGVGGKPAYPRSDNVRTESIFVHTLEPSQTQAEGVLLINNSAVEETIAVYAVDSVASSDGAFACAQQGDAKVSVGAWVALEQSEVTLAAGSQKIVPFTITVPEIVDVGEHNGCIVVQKLNQDKTTEGSMNLSFRSAMRVAITIPGDIQRVLTITELTAVPPGDAGLTSITLGVANTGNVSLDADTTVVTQNVFGQDYFVHDGTYPVLRGETASWHYELPDDAFWGGWFQSSATVSYDGHDEGSLGQDSGLDKTVLTAQTGWFFLIPSTAGILIELLMILLVVIIVFCMMLMQQRRKRLVTNWVKHTVKTGEDLEVLAKRTKVSWKLLAKINHLKAPYRITVGDQILVPPISSDVASNLKKTTKKTNSKPV